MYMHRHIIFRCVICTGGIRTFGNTRQNVAQARDVLRRREYSYV